MRATSPRARLLRRLQRFGADRAPHGRDRSLQDHLVGSWALLSRWCQPDWVCEAGAFHSVYGTDVYERRLVPRSDRHLVRAAIGEVAERLVFLFSVMARRAFTDAVEALPEIPAEGLGIPCRSHHGRQREHATRDEVAALLLLLIANQAEQACAPDRGPTPWLAHASALARKARGSSLPAPPVFDRGRAHVCPEDEASALDAYRSGVLAMRTDPGTARRHLAGAAALLPWVGEPALWLAYLDLQQGDPAAAASGAAQGRKGLERWGVPWDKRMSFDQWEWLAGFVLDQAAGPAELGPLPAPQAEALAGFPDTLQSRARQQVFLGLGRCEEVQPGSARLQRYLASFATNASDPRMKIYPGLTARPWHDADAFPLARALSASYDAIRSEILALDQGAFAPESEPIARTGSWDVLFMFERGRKDEAVCAACPVTTRVVEEHGALRTLAGLVYVSRLRPGTHVVPHTGPTNLRLRCHLGIAVPPGNCGIRVEGQTRRWVEGGCIVFDDFLEHEAWNHAGTDRIVLIVDLWHPDLEPDEIAMLEGLHRYAAAHAISLDGYWRANEHARGRGGPSVPDRRGDESAVEYLRRLEALGTLLFHGSPCRGIERLEPRPATDGAGGAWSNDTAVYAVPAVVAVGRAILPPRNRVRGRWEIRASRAPGPPGGPLLAVSPNVRLGGGSVYVVDRGAFLENAALHEWKSGRPVRVLAEVTVTANDYVALGGRIETRPVPVVGDRSPGPPGTASAPGRGRVRSGES